MPGVLSRSFLEEVVHNSGWSIAEVESLSLAGEGISSLEDGCPFEGARRLVYLDLSQNHLSSLRGVEHLTSLATLILRENRVESIDEVGRLARLSNLRNLDLRLNPVMSGTRMSFSQNRAIGGSERSRSSGGGSSNGSSRSRNGGSSSSSGSSRETRARIVSAVPQLESLNGRRVSDKERTSPRKQRSLRRPSHDPGGEECDVIHVWQYTQRQRQGRQQLQQERPQSQPPSNPQDQRHGFQHQSQSQCQARRPREHGKRPDSPALARPIRIADDASMQQAIKDDEELRASGRRRGSDDSEARREARDSNDNAWQSEDPAMSRSHDRKWAPSFESSRRPRNSGEVAGQDDFSRFFPAGTSALAPAIANMSSSQDIHDQRRVAYAAHAHRNLSAPVQRSCETSPTQRDTSSREPVVYLLDDGDNDNLFKDNDIDHGIGLVRQRQDFRVLGTGADKDAPASPGSSTFQPPAAAVVHGMNRRRGRRGPDDVVGAVVASTRCGSNRAASRSSTARRECVTGKATYGGDGKGFPECRDGVPRETPAVAEHVFEGAGGKDQKATPRRSPQRLSQDAGAGAAWPSVAGVSVAASSARKSEAPVKGSGGDAVFDSGDGADGDLAALWRELQGVDDSPCGSDSGSRGQNSLTLSSLSSTYHSCTSPIATSTAAPTSTARTTTAKTDRTRPPESSGAARAVEAFRRSSKRLGFLPAPAPAVPGGDGSGGGGSKGRARCDTDIHESRRADGIVAFGANDPFPAAQNIAAPVQVSACRTTAGFDRSDGDPEFESIMNGIGGGSGSPVDSDGGGNCQGRGHDARNATFAQAPASTSPPKTLSAAAAAAAAAAVVERALPSAEVATGGREAGSESPIAGPARTPGPVVSGMEPTADAPTISHSSKPRAGDLPANGTSTMETARGCIAPHARERFAGRRLEEGCVAGARAWDEAPDVATAGVSGDDSTEAVEERWRAREREFALRWAAREREFEERWAAREREIEHRHREDFSQGFTAEMRSMLLGAHEALISSNAWLVERLKTLEATAAAGACGAQAPGLSEARPESTTAPRADPANVTPANATDNERTSIASSRRRPVAEGRDTLSFEGRPGCRSATVKVDGIDRDAPSLGELGRTISIFAGDGAAATEAEGSPCSFYSSCSSHLVRGVVGVDADAPHGALVHRASSVTVGTAPGKAASVQSRRREGDDVTDRGPHVLPATSAAAAVSSDIRAAMAGYEELLRSRRRNIDGSTPCGLEGGGVKEVAATARGVRAPLRPAARISNFVDQSSAVAVAVETAAAVTSSPPKTDSREPGVVGPREDGVSLSRPAAVVVACSCPVDGTANTRAGAAPPLEASSPSIVIDEGMIEAGCGEDSNDSGGEFGIDPEVTVSTAPSH